MYISDEWGYYIVNTHAKCNFGLHQGIVQLLSTHNAIYGLNGGIAQLIPMLNASFWFACGYCMIGTHA